MNIKIKSKFTFPFSPLPFHIAIIITPILLTIIACSPTTEISKGNLSGVIALEGMEDNSAIIVAIYDLAYLDTTIVRINQEYPQIGVIISQHTEFDHRLQSPLYTTETEADGSFMIENIPTGVYNVVCSKFGYGFRHLYEINITDGENSLSEMGKGKWEKDFSHLPFHFSQSSARYPLSRRDNRSILSDITLYAEHHISGIISEDIYLAPFHHLVIDSDTEFIPGTNFTIMPNAVVRINPGEDLIIHGNLTAQGEEDNMFWVTSNDGFEVKGNGKWGMGKNPSHFSPFTSHTNRDSLALYNSMELSPVASVTDDLIEWGKWSWGNEGFICKSINLIFKSNLMYKANEGFTFSNMNKLFFEYNLIYYTSGYDTGGINVIDVSESKISNTLLMKQQNGITIKNYGEQIVEKNIIIQSEIGIKVLYYADFIINNNFIDTYNKGILVTESSTGIINKNFIKSNICISTNRLYDYTIGCFENNLLFNVYSIEVGWRSYINIQANNNFFYTIHNEEILLSIFDKNDVELENEEFYCYVEYQPFSINAFVDAGIY